MYSWIVKGVQVICLAYHWVLQKPLASPERCHVMQVSFMDLSFKKMKLGQQHQQSCDRQLLLSAVVKQQLQTWTQHWVEIPVHTDTEPVSKRDMVHGSLEWRSCVTAAVQ